MSEKYIKVEGYPDLVRDPSTNAILNIDHEKILIAKRKKELRRQEKLQRKNLEDRIDSLESDMKEIKDGISYLINTYK